MIVVTMVVRMTNDNIGWWMIMMLMQDSDDDDGCADVEGDDSANDEFDDNDEGDNGEDDDKLTWMAEEKYKLSQTHDVFQDIVTESSSFDLVAFIPLLRERIYTRNPFARQFVVSWVSMCQEFVTSGDLVVAVCGFYIWSGCQYD